jgi:hypothetical protein
MVDIHSARLWPAGVVAESSGMGRCLCLVIAEAFTGTRTHSYHRNLEIDQIKTGFYCNCTVLFFDYTKIDLCYFLIDFYQAFACGPW